MNTQIKIRTDKMMVIALTFLGIFLVIPHAGWCQADVARQAEQKVEQSIQIRQLTQKERSQWEQEKNQLVLLYEQLQQQKTGLEKENTILLARQAAQKQQNQTLLKQKTESIRVQKELVPFMNRIYTRLETLVANDPPFLKEERTIRLATLDKVMKAPDITISEKYRKVMEALFIETEYGSTIEVYQDKVRVGTQDILGNIFRLGRVSLFFLSLDQTESAVFNVGTKQWQPLTKDCLAAIRSAVEIGSKRRPVELLSLPLGRLAAQGGDQ